MAGSAAVRSAPHRGAEFAIQDIRQHQHAHPEDGGEQTKSRSSALTLQQVTQPQNFSLEG
jgi:hypothetical protein